MKRFHFPLERVRRWREGQAALEEMKLEQLLGNLAGLRLERETIEVERTRDLFYRGFPLVERLPAELQSDIELFIRFGLAILRKIERCAYNVWKTRPVIGKWEKAALVGGFLLRRVQTYL